MASGGDSNGLKVTLIFMGILLVVSFVMVYMYKSELSATTEQLTKVKAERDSANKTLTNRASELLEMQELMGTGSAETGEAIEAIKKALVEFGKNLSQPNVSQTLAKIRDALNDADSRARQLQKNLDEAKQQNIDQDRIAQATIAEHQEARDKANRDLRKVKDDAEETIAGIREQNEKLNDEKFRLQTEFDEYVETAENEIANQKAEIRKLINAVAKLDQELATLKETSYEIADGKIIRTDFNAGLVYINIGKAQALTPRTRFSVYIKKNRGVARGTDEVKGAIEVTEILGNSEAVARIIDEDLGRPIAKGDPIYSPAWSANSQLAISTVGLIDLDGDGEMDRDRFHELLALNDASIDNEVDDQGNRTGEGISVNTKFLVIGDIPDLKTEFGNLTVDTDAIKAMANAQEQMIQEARAQGVRIITLRDFLQYLGYRPTQRIWRRGSSGEWNLNYGRRLSKAAVESGKYHSMGTVSPLFSRSKKLPPVYSKFSPVSKLFKGVDRSYP